MRKAVGIRGRGSKKWCLEVMTFSGKSKAVGSWVDFPPHKRVYFIFQELELEGFARGGNVVDLLYQSMSHSQQLNLRGRGLIMKSRKGYPFS
jgi:hypothetical protein